MEEKKLVSVGSFSRTSRYLESESDSRPSFQRLLSAGFGSATQIKQNQQHLQQQQWQELQEQHGSLFERLEQAGAHHRTALTVAGGGRQWQHGELFAAARAAAAALQHAGAMPGGVVLLSAQCTPEAVLTLLGIAALGAVAAPVNPKLLMAECQYCLADLQPLLVILPEQAAGTDGGAMLDAAMLASVPVVLCSLNDASGQLLLKKTQMATSSSTRQRPVARKADVAPSPTSSPVLLLYTADGTNASSPRAVTLSQGQLLAGCAAAAAAFRLSCNDATLMALPIYHAQGLVNGLFAPLLAGGEVRHRWV